VRVEIKCKGSRTAKLDDLKPLQGDLKELSEENYNKLKTEILELGFSAPFFVWSHVEGVERETLDLIDGHQRQKTLICMREEKIEMPDEFPIVEVDAKSYKQAKKKILAISSNYGTMTTLGLESFMQDVDMKLDDIANSFTFDAIDFDVMKYAENADNAPEQNDSNNVTDEEKFIIILECKDELEQNDLFEEFQTRELNCKLMS